VRRESNFSSNFDPGLRFSYSAILDSAATFVVKARTPKAKGGKLTALADAAVADLWTQNGLASFALVAGGLNGDKKGSFTEFYPQNRITMLPMVPLVLLLIPFLSRYIRNRCLASFGS
jgi:hypothetical protein